jgi:hypothetical protein
LFFRVDSQGANPRNRLQEKKCVLKEHRIGKGGVEVRGAGRGARGGAYGVVFLRSGRFPSIEQDAE